jgi:Patatin-like phospholipase
MSDLAEQESPVLSLLRDRSGVQRVGHAVEDTLACLRIKEWLGDLHTITMAIDLLAVCLVAQEDFARAAGLCGDGDAFWKMLRAHPARPVLRRDPAERRGNLPWEYQHYGLDHAGQQVIDAVRASVSIPFFYKPARLTDADGRDCWLVDGAMLSRFPLEVFDAPPGLEPRWPTFGIKLGGTPRAASEVTDTKSMSWAMLSTMTGFYDRVPVTDAAAAARTIVVDTGPVKATDFDLDRDTQDFLFRQGRQAAVNFLDGHDRRHASPRPRCGRPQLRGDTPAGQSGLAASSRAQRAGWKSGHAHR